MTETARLVAYGGMGLPLAMVALPVYVQVPVYYTTEVGLSLALTGWVLFAARLIDTVQDPWLGLWVDRLKLNGRLAVFMAFAAVLFAAVFFALWQPQVQGSLALAIWLALALAGVYTLHSFLNIAYLSWGARLSDQAQAITRAAGWREAAGLLGVVLASAGPAWLVSSGWDQRTAMVAYSALFSLTLMAGLWALLKLAPPWRPHSTAERVTLGQAIKTPVFRGLLIPFTLNAVAVAVPATLALFFINDRIQASELAGLFLASYFLAGALGLPLWMKVADRTGPVRAWRLGMLLAIAAFIWAIALGAGDVIGYWVVCVLAGLALGADLAMPPVVLARVIPLGQTPAGYYGIWSLLGKLALAVSGLLLPLLAAFSYYPGRLDSNLTALAVLYAGVPCLLKMLAWFSLTAFSRSYSKEFSL